MSSSNITHQKSRPRSYSDQHTDVDEHHGSKNEPHKKNIDTFKKQNSVPHTTVHGIKDSRKHVRSNTHSGNEVRYTCQFHMQ